MFPSDVALKVKALEVLPDRRFRNAKCRREIANAGASLFLQPLKNLHAARFGQQIAADSLSAVRSRADRDRTSSGGRRVHGSQDPRGV